MAGPAHGVDHGVGRALIELRRDAGAALDAVDDDPARALELAQRVLAGRGSTRDAEAEAVALRALGMATRELGQPGAAQVHLEQAVAVAHAAGLHDLAHATSVTLALTLAVGGDGAAALRMVDDAAAHLRGVEQARAVAQRCQILARTGRTAEALAGMAGALAALRSHADARWTGRMLINRGLVRTLSGDHEGAAADLAEAVAIFEALGGRLKAAQARHNLGFVAYRRGDLPTALAAFDAADTALTALGFEPVLGRLDRCEALMAALLADEAAGLAAGVVRDLDAAGAGADAAEARVVLARAHLLGRRPAEAATVAEEAADALERQARPGWALFARSVALQARAADDLAAVDPAEAAGLAEQLVRHGWPLEADQARLVAARAALAAGDREGTAAILARVRAPARAAPVALRVGRWHAAALLRLAGADVPGALRALRTGLAEVEVHRATLGATDLRAHASGHAQALADLGLELAVRGGRPRSVFAWAERSRAAALALPPARPPQDAELAEDLASLRRVAEDLRQMVSAGEDAAPLRREQVALERRIAGRARQAAGAGRAVVTATAPEVLEALGEAALVEYLQVGGRRGAVVLRAGRAHLRDLGEAGRTDDAVASLRFALRRLADQRRPAAAQAGAHAALTAAAAQLEDALLAPVAGLLGDGPLVLVPSGALVALPWAALPAAAARPTIVIPSATVWLQARRRVEGAAGGTVLVAGPRLPHATAEVLALADAYRCDPLTGDAAAVGPVLAALDGAAVAHLATHGRFRGDNPLFSALELADGDLTVHDLARLNRPPRTMVLSACDSAQAALLDGGEVLGLGAALLGLGVASVVASPVEVPDLATAVFMASFHRHLRGGAGPAAALAAARGDHRATDDPGLRATAASFACYGAG